MPRQLTRLVTRSVAVPVLLALAAMLGLVVLAVAARMAADPLVHTLPLQLLPTLAAALIAPLLSVALPLGFFAGLVAAITRLEADGAVDAARCLGATPLQLVLPTGPLALGVAALTFVAGAWGEPWGRHLARHEIARLSGPDLHYREGALTLELDDLVLGAANVDAGGALSGVLLWARDGAEVVIAPRGTISLADGELRAELHDGEVHLQLDGGYARAGFEEYRVSVPLPLLRIRGREPFELAPQALLAAIRDRSADGKEVRFHQLALHRRLAIPLAVPLMALLAWPLGRSRSGHGLVRGVLLAAATGLGYYLLLRVGDHGLREYHWPPVVAAWMATALLVPAAAMGWVWRWSR